MEELLKQMISLQEATLAEIRGLRTDLMSDDGIAGFVKSSSFSLCISRPGDNDPITVAQIADDIIEAIERLVERMTFQNQMQVLAMKAVAEQGTDVHIEAIQARAAQLEQEDKGEEPSQETTEETPGETPADTQIEEQVQESPQQG